MAIVAGVRGAGRASITVGQGRGDVFLHGQPSRSGGKDHGNGSAAIPVDRSSGGGQSTGFTDDINRSGYATRGARYGGISRGPEVPLPIPTPKKGNANDVTNIWCHGKSLEGNAWSCSYCGAVKLGGGATRFKQHLAGLGPECYSCLSAPHHVVAVFRKGIPEGIDRRRKAKEGKKRVVDEVNHLNNLGTSIHIDCEDEDDEILRQSLQNSLHEDHGRTSGVRGTVGSSGGVKGSSSGGVKGSSSGGVKDFFDVDLAYSRTRPQQTMEVCINKAEYESRIGKAWAKWFHANDIPGHKANCPYFVGPVKLTQDLGKGVPAPKGIDIDGIYLNSNYEELQQYVAKFKDDWPTYGVTIMSDSWTGPSRMSIINFMVFSNGRMYFHKSVNATGHMQNSKFVYEHIKEVIEEIGQEHVVQLVTDNGSNFKKACLDLVVDFPHITWQPCAAHTINLMLKEMGCFPEINTVVNSCKRICRFMHNHSTLHAEMQKHIGGELVRPNATRFGTNFMFLESFWDKQEKFKVWMTSPEWKNSSWSSEVDYDYTYDCLTSRKWWDDVKMVLDVIGPIYTILRYADSQKLGSLSGFMKRMMQARHHLSSSFPEESLDQQKYLKVVDKRVEHLYQNTLMVAVSRSLGLKCNAYAGNISSTVFNSCSSDQ
ncbi:uncharacterized protein LOC125523790 isoform X2 [Triticum urartu]|uniref:uncharacterized protein LOC125523790 isoform X2 n=1 Tax=Triticum urartu TaxID=4572 RepID=UPI00204435EE|nr:uncharacterized protein LOC125523790 isoform X2 [Triticum urartu]